MKEDEKLVKSLDTDGNEITVLIKKPTQKDYRESQLVYNKAFREALDSGALLRQRLSDYMRDQGIWNDDKQQKNDKYVEEIREKENLLKAGGIKLSDAKEIALELRTLRTEFQLFLAERNQLDGSTAEGQADNARFSELVRLCLLNVNTKKPYFPQAEDYEKNLEQPWVIEASSEIANLLYGLDPDYAKNLEENKFLKEFNFVNEDLRLVNDEGHLVDIDGRLINSDGRFVAYRTEEARKNQDKSQMYYVNAEGQEVVAVEEDGEEDWVRVDLKERKPFLDDGGNPIVNQEPETAEKPKRKKRATKKETENA